MSGKKIICIVDDDEAVRDSTGFLLESHGLAARSFGSAREFIDQAPFLPVGCLVLDMHMPELSGLDLLRLLRMRGAQMPVLLVSGRRDPALDQEAWDAGATAILPKPFNEEALLAWVREALAK